MLMHQTIYIDVDEEITGILDRIRQEQAVDIFLVVPKGAMLINSIINLKLLKKEAEKMGKKVVIVAPNDKRARNIIERAGLKMEEYSEQLSREGVVDQQVGNEPKQGNTNHQQEVHRAVEESLVSDVRSSELGSDSFFAGGGNNLDMQRRSNKVDKSVGRQSSEIINGGTSSNQSNINNNQDETVGENKDIQDGFVDNFNRQEGQGELGVSDLESKEAQYFQHFDENGQSVGFGGKKKASRDKKIKKRRKKLMIILLTFFLVCFVIAIKIVSKYPRLDLVIYPLHKQINEEIKFMARDGVDKIDLAEKVIPGEYMEISLEKTMEFEATGSKIIDKNAGVARGKVTIYNYFSEKPQGLVKTTRILSKKDGKLFHLNKTVVVPGMKDDEPGKVEVEVYADKPGEEYNIGPDDFEIFVWRNTPKGEKFKIKSETAMTGGMLSDKAVEKKVVTKEDLDMARKKVIEELDKSINEELNKRFNEGQMTVEDAIEKEIISSKSSHQEGAVTDKFTYTVEYKLKLVAFYKNDADKFIREFLQEKFAGKYKPEEKLVVEFKRGILDSVKKNLTVYAGVEGKAWFQVPVEEIKTGVIGADKETIRSVLSKEAGVSSAEIKPSPSWVNKAPKNKEKINIQIVEKIRGE